MKRSWILCFVLFLTACTTPDTRENVEDAKPEMAPETEDATPSASTTPGEAPSAEPALAKPVFDPAIFIGLTASDLESGYGSPHLRREEGTAQVWQYMEGDCVLHLFLYAAGEGGGTAPGYRVEHVEARIRPSPEHSGGDPDLTAAVACAGPFGVVKESAEPEIDNNESGENGPE